MRPLLLILLIASTPAPAAACGGMFCAQQPPGFALQPVEQAAERILFEVDEVAETITDNGNPCEDINCRLGSCLALNGFPTCRCDPLAAAVNWGGVPRCREVVAVHGPQQILAGPPEANPDPVQSRALPVGGPVTWAMLAGATLWARRRARRV